MLVVETCIGFTIIYATMSDGSITALILRSTRVDWTVLQLRKSRPEIVQQKSVDLDWPEDMADHFSPEAAAHLKSKLPPISGLVGIVVPAGRVLMRVVDLPSLELEELRGMAELQVDKFSPFPTEQMAIAVEILQQGASSSRVLIAAVQHEVIDQLGDFLANTGVYPQLVDVDVMGWWTLIRDAGHVAGSEGQEIIIMYEEQAAQMLLLRDGVPVVIRTLDTTLQLEEPAFANELLQELEYTLMTAEGTWGAASTRKLTIWTKGAPPAKLIEELSVTCAFPVAASDLASLPPLSEGISRRLAGPEASRLDLAPAAWRSGMQSKMFQRRAISVASAALAVWILLMGVLWFFSHRQKQLLSRAQADMTRVQAEVEEIRNLQTQVEWLQDYADRTYSSLECLREIAEILPEGVEITSITYNKSSQVNLRGEADADGPVNDFISKLEKSSLFTSVKTEGISTTQRGGMMRSQFRVTMMLPGAEVEGEGEAEES